MGIFGNKEKKLNEALKILSKSLFQCTFSIAEAINTSLESQQKKPLTDMQFLGVIKEIFCFYLHYFDRIAMQEGGEKYYAWLQDNMVQTCSELLPELIISRPESVQKGLDAQKWKSRMANECIDLYNKRGQEYISLALTADSGFPKDDTVFGKLIFNIGQVIGIDKMDNLSIMFEMPLWIMQSASTVKLTDQVRSLKRFL